MTITILRAIAIVAGLVGLGVLLVYFVSAWRD
jgi:hypothetical protein